LNIILFGLALNPNFENLRLGVVDYSATPESRELISAFTEGLVFKINGYYPSPDDLGRVISKGDIDAGLVIPRDFADRRARQQTSQVQLLVDAVNANTATIAGGYAARIVASLNQQIAMSQPRRQQIRDPNSTSGAIAVTTNPAARASVVPHLTLLYNPGLKS